MIFWQLGIYLQLPKTTAMRKIYFKLLMALLLIVPEINYAQTYLSEGFESAFTGSPAAPTGWTQTKIRAISSLTGERDWNRITYSGTWSPSSGGTNPASAYAGTSALWIDDRFFMGNSTPQASNRMESPAVDLSVSTSPYLRFWYFNNEGVGVTLNLRVLISADGGTNWQSLTPIVNGFNTANTTWNRISIAIPASYRTANMKFAFELTNKYGTSNPFIDNVTVEEYTPTTVTSTASGDWNNTATWVGGVIPTADNHVVIASGHTVTVTNATSSTGIFARCQNLQVDGTLAYGAGTANLLHAYGNITVNGTFNAFNSTSGRLVFCGGNFTVSSSGTANFSNGTTAQSTSSTSGISTGAAGIVWLGNQPAVFSNAGTLTSGVIQNLLHLNPGGTTYNSAVTCSRTLGLYLGAVNPNGNLTVGLAAVTTQTIERANGSFTSEPIWGASVTRSVNYYSPNWVPLTQTTINTGHEIETIAMVKTVAGTLTLNTHNHIQLNTPVRVGTATTGGLTLTRGILITTPTNLLSVSPFLTGATGTAPSTATPPTTHGSYVVGPVRIDFPATGTSTRNFPLGRGTSFNGTTPNSNVLKTVALSNSAAWASQTITATIEGTASGTVTSPLTALANGITYRLNLNAGPDLPATAWVTLLGNNYTHGGGVNSDNLLGELGQLHIAQSTTQNGTWTTRVIPSGSGVIANNTNNSRSTATGAPGPIGPLATNGEYFSFATSASTTDLGAVALAAPTGIGCYTNAMQVKITIRNNGVGTVDFAMNPVTVNTAVTGAATTNLSGTLNSGTLAPNATVDVTMSGTLDMTASGTYTFNASTVITGDANASNDAMTTATRTNAAAVTLPHNIDFTGYTGANLTTVFTNWYEATGSTPAGTTSAWTNRTGYLGGATNVAAGINLYTNTRNEWIIGPKFTPTSVTQLKLDVAVTDFVAVTPDVMGSDDKVQVMVSTDCGLTWTAVKTFTAADNLPNALTPQTINLGAYNGQTIIVAFYATDGPIDDAEDYDFHIDNVQIVEGSAIDMGATALVSPVLNACYTSTENVTVTIRNYGVSTINFVTDPVTVTTNVTGAVTTTLTKTVNTGTLAAGATLNVTMDGTLDMTATGTYTFNANTSVAGDGDAMNNTMTAATRLVTVTVGTPLTENFDAGTTLPSGWSTVNTWTIGATHARGGSGNGIYKNIYSTAPNGTIQLPKAGSIATGDYFNFAYRIVEFNAYPATATSNASNWGNIQIQVSSNCGSTYSTLATINNMNHISTTDWAAKAYSLSAYNGQNIIVRIVANWGTGDWFIDLDDISISNTPLPVTLTNLRGERKNDINLLSWTTLTEQNNAGFQVERSADGTNFSSLGFVSSKANGGNSTSTINYVFTDSRALNSNNYYRLKQVDKDGKATYSNVVLVKGQRVKNLELTAVYPNPAISKINIVIAAPANDRVTVMVTDLSGKLVKQQAMQVIAGDNNVQIDVQNLANGTYIIKAVCANGCETAVSKFVKQ